MSAPTVSEWAKLPINQPAEFDRLSDQKKQAVLTWIKACFEPSHRACEESSYGIKHWFEEETGLYVTNGAFKGAMIAAGLDPVDTSLVNWQFRCKWTQKCQSFTSRGVVCRCFREPRDKYCIRHQYDPRTCLCSRTPDMNCPDHGVDPRT